VKVVAGPWGKLEYAVPPGSPDGRVVRIKGMGAPGSQGGAAGDLVITFRILAPEPPEMPDESPVVEPIAEKTPPEAPVEKPADPRSKELASQIASAQSDLDSAEAKLKSGAVMGVPGSLALVVFCPVFVYLLYCAVNWLIWVSWFPRSITEFLAPYLPFAGWLCMGVLTLGALAGLVEAIKGSLLRASLRRKITNLRSELARLNAPKLM